MRNTLSLCAIGRSERVVENIGAAVTRHACGSKRAPIADGARRAQHQVVCRGGGKVNASAMMLLVWMMLDGLGGDSSYMKLVDFLEFR